jgi:hypothetical protein
MLYYAIPFLVSAMIFLFFVYFALKKTNKIKLNFIFILLSMSVFFWQISWFFLQIFNDQDIFIIKFGHIFILLLPVLLYHLGSLILNNVNKIVLSIFYLWTFILEVILLFSNKIVDGTHQKFWGIYPKAGDLHFVFMATVIIVISSISYKLFIAFLKNKIKEQKKQYLYTLVGILLFSVSAIDFLANYSFDVYPIGFVFLLFFISLIFYAISKYNLISIRNFSDKFFVSVSLSFWFSFFWITVLWFEDRYFGSVFSATSIIMNIFIIPFFIFFFIDIYKSTSVFSQKVFKTFNKKEKLMTVFSEIPNTKKEISEYLSKKFSIIFDTEAIVFYKNNSMEVSICASTEGFEDNFLGDKKDLWNSFVYRNKFTILEEQKLKSIMPNSHRDDFIEILNENRIDIFVPIENQEIFLLLGEKINGERYSSEEIKFLKEVSGRI